MADQDETAVIPLAAEQLGFGELLAREEIEIERRAVGRLVNEAPAVRATPRRGPTDG